MLTLPLTNKTTYRLYAMVQNRGRHAEVCSYNVTRQKKVDKVLDQILYICNINYLKEVGDGI